MQPLKDYLNESPLSEGIFDRMKNNIKGNINRLSDSIIRKIIYKYCADWHTWRIAQPTLKVTKVDKDEKGWYVDTETRLGVFVLNRETAKSFYDYYPFNGQKMDKQKGFLIEDKGVYFRWRKHKGTLIVKDCPNVESTEGLPEEVDVLCLIRACQNSKKFDIYNKITAILLSDVADVKISGDDCKNVIFDPDNPCDHIDVPNGVKIHQPADSEACWAMAKKFIKL